MHLARRSFMRTATAAAVAFLLLSTPITSFAWSAGGHMMIAQIAYGRLNKKAKSRAVRLLAIPINPASVSAKSKDFINASHWADDLRPFPEFDSFKALHFLDIPFSADGTPLPSDLPEPGNLVTALKENVKILQTSKDEKAQAQALRLIIHFVGDIHQPLHCSTRIDSNHPDGDRGGNLFSFKIPDAGGKLRTTNLHSYWDGGLGSFPPTGANFSPPPLKTISPAATAAMKENPPSARELRLGDPFDFESWGKESFEIARSSAYEGLKPNSTPSSAYTSRNLKVVRQRVAWAGYRLAALLNAIWPDS